MTNDLITSQGLELKAPVLELKAPVLDWSGSAAYHWVKAVVGSTKSFRTQLMTASFWSKVGLVTPKAVHQTIVRTESALLWKHNMYSS